MTFGLFLGENQIGFQCFANYVPHRKGTIIQYHSNRTVIHPDYAGLGMGIKLINLTSEYVKDKYKCRVMAKFSSAPVYKAMIRQKDWKFLGAKKLMGKMNRSGNMDRSSGFREYGVKTYHFEFKPLSSGK